MKVDRNLLNEGYGIINEKAIVWVIVLSVGGKVLIKG